VIKIEVSQYTKNLLDGIIVEGDFIGEYKTYDDIIGYICTYYILKRKKK
jgi:hypothetical protein